MFRSDSNHLDRARLQSNGNSRQIQFSMKLEYQTIIKAKSPQISNASRLTYDFPGVFVVTQGDEACVS